MKRVATGMREPASDLASEPASLLQQEWGSFINNIIISVVVINNCSAQETCMFPAVSIAIAATQKFIL